LSALTTDQILSLSTTLINKTYLYLSVKNKLSNLSAVGGIYAAVLGAKKEVSVDFLRSKTALLFAQEGPNETKPFLIFSRS
jgi:hypothetical protein